MSRGKLGLAHFWFTIKRQVSGFTGVLEFHLQCGANSVLVAKRPTRLNLVRGYSANICRPNYRYTEHEKLDAPALLFITS